MFCQDNSVISLGSRAPGIKAIRLGSVLCPSVLGLLAFVIIPRQMEACLIRLGAHQTSYLRLSFRAVDMVDPREIFHVYNKRNFLAR